MKPECIITCVNYDDTLKLTLAQTMSVLKIKPWVITSMGDSGTARVVEKHNARLFRTDKFHLDGAAFNKAAALNALIGSGLLALDGWMIHMDADVFLHDGALRVIEVEATEKECLYGSPRIAFADQEAWDAKDCATNVPLWKKEETPGYFQLFWAPSVSKPWYDESCEHAGIYDSYFQSRWKGAQKRKLSCPIIHLGILGQNWFGRRTARWSGESTEPPDPENVERLYRRHEQQKVDHTPLGERRKAKLVEPEESKEGG